MSRGPASHTLPGWPRSSLSIQSSPSPSWAMRKRTARGGGYNGDVVHCPSRSGARVGARKDTSMLTPGDPAPDFALPNRDGNLVHLSDFRGKHVMLFNFSSW